MVGHTSAKVTLDTYADLFDTDLDAVAAALPVPTGKQRWFKYMPLAMALADCPVRSQFPAASDFRNCVSNTRRGANRRSALSCRAEPAA